MDVGGAESDPERKRNPWKSPKADGRTRTGDPFITSHAQVSVDAGGMRLSAADTAIATGCRCR
jgi:hypothetical protein